MYIMQVQRKKLGKKTDKKTFGQATETAANGVLIMQKLYIIFVTTRSGRRVRINSYSQSCNEHIYKPS